MLEDEILTFNFIDEFGDDGTWIFEAAPQSYIHQSSRKRQVQGITEQLKDEDAFEWTERVNNIRAYAR